MKSLIFLISILLTSALAASCEAGDSDTVTVALGSSTEERLLGRIAIEMLKMGDVEVDEAPGLEGTDEMRQALQSDSIDLYWGRPIAELETVYDEMATSPLDALEEIRDKDREQGFAWLLPTSTCTEAGESSMCFTPVVPNELLEDNPKATDLLNAVSLQLNGATFQYLLQRTDSGESVNEVAASFADWMCKYLVKWQ